MTLEFWFDFASTYSYPAALRLEKLSKQINIEWKPFLLGPIFRAQGLTDSPFNLFPAKGKYMWRDMERLSQKYSFHFSKPSIFPRNGLTAARISLLAEKEHWLPEFISAVFVGNFANNRDISDLNFLKDTLESLGLSAEHIIEQAQSPETKDRLRSQTETASQLGVFGAPTFIINQEMFWGNDRLEDALNWYSSRQ
ncbi:MAG: 2-hydroxychromene-2-carboxylate isomerase [SAR324 cluster bacterium]|nr:2-hydroxychromene-2-carboxylate isomerase [SAR324 cluster bacterium]